MNYLVHLSLGFPEETLVTGNFIGDLITKQEEKAMSPTLTEGIRLHRWIDVYSNNHETLRQINKVFHPYIHKYAPVATDIVCDFFLANSWSKYMPEKFQNFKEFNYTVIRNQLSEIPDRIQPACIRMIEHDWLGQYKNMDNLVTVLHRMEQKTKFTVDLQQIAKVSLDNYTFISEMFEEFLSDCQKDCRKNFNLQNEMKL